MPSLKAVVASTLLLFVISSNGLPILASHDVGHSSDLQTGHYITEDEAASAWKRVLCELMHPHQGVRKRTALTREELDADRIQNGGQMVGYLPLASSLAQHIDTKAELRDANAEQSTSLSPSQTSGYSPDALGVIANALNDEYLPDYLNGYARDGSRCILLAQEYSSRSRASFRSTGPIEFLTPGMIITVVVILLLVTIAFFDFMQWIHLYRRRSQSRRRRPSRPSSSPDDKLKYELRYSDGGDDDSRREMMIP
ncbi:uncharacterized protein GIQ15_03935 [Arthroderma uncinatum]|uniref:uncharacterized protein n=1 Tax=Arthroderma uncinatum TaxID=74035 RepID=UPI00144A8FDA|nr:uncharacterized protein GIQ15_03935 [Arthroderma uncinatum]KAF3481176.1 hypothetical protein GIQ15_03935 [Arthroderma uncinatum]